MNLNENLPDNTWTLGGLLEHLHNHRDDLFFKVRLNHSEELSEIIFSTDLELHLPLEEINIARTYHASTVSYMDSHLIYKGIDTVGKKCTPGILPSHEVLVTIKKEMIKVVLPEVDVWRNPVSYVTAVEQASGSELGKVLLRCLGYCYRLGMPTGKIATAAMSKGMKWDTYAKIQEKAKKYSDRLPTIDATLSDWVTEAALYCNTIKQVDMLVWIYREAATYCTMQPVICKARMAEQLGCSTKAIRNLVGKLQKNGMLEEGPESSRAYDHVAGRPNSNPRILNLDIRQDGRWWMQSLTPPPDRSIEKKLMKQRKTEVLAGNGYWKESK
ncbi:hypothetical protein [Rhodococcus sp. (in: high G+C Gram-positive bacteria)]|uniref:hypothetical protein n=1 Tax=Rhodococcus sp. TaxID=1831 RepID=UPI001A2D8CB0|nr:hypothetical protein [Rhodococcus sp. (in: high G+C Gram-positive bacteria)]MBJ7479700.1 hypothetical protein [Rhodococcus sp. (in: high G+C Gram-positive bacteria)]